VGVRKISISIPEDLLAAVDSYARELGVSRSELISAILREKLKPREAEREYPTVLWKLKLKGSLKLRSPRRPGRRVGEWVVEEVSSDLLSTS